MGRLIEHELLAPDGRHIAVIAGAHPRNGETIQRFIRRQDWYFHLPTRCFVNGEVIRPEKLRTYRIRRRDEIRIVSRPGRGGSSGASTAKSVGAIVALVSLSILAPWAGGIAAAGLQGATLLGTSYATAAGPVRLASEPLAMEALL